MQIFKQKIPALSDFIYTLDNKASTSAKKFIIGDPFDMVKQDIATTGVVPSLLNGSAKHVAPNKKSFGFINGLAFSEVRIEASVEAAQLGNKLVFVQCNHTGNSVTSNIDADVPNYASNTKKAQVAVSFLLSALSALVYIVNAGEKVTITLVPAVKEEMS